MLKNIHIKKGKIGTVPIFYQKVKEDVEIMALLVSINDLISGRDAAKAGEKRGRFKK